MSPKFAPREIFEVLLEWSVIPTFDLLIEYGDQGIIFLKRKIEPYNDTWALPGLRMYKGESINHTLERIAKQELGLAIDVSKARLLGQYVGKFKSEHERQDLSTCYAIKLSGTEELSINQEHFSAQVISKSPPPSTGAMYRYYFDLYTQSL